MKSLHKSLKNSEILIGSWVTIGSPAVAEINGWLQL